MSQRKWKKKQQQKAAQQKAVRQETRKRPGLLGLQESAGNQAVSNMLGSLSDAPRPTVVRTPTGLLVTVYFAKNSALLDATNFKVIEQLAGEIRFLLEPVVTVDGYASAEGEESYNLALSRRRRQTTISLLEAQVKQPLDIGGDALGETDPAVPETAEGSNKVEQQRAQNRRVEITIIRQPNKLPRTPDIVPTPRYLDPNLPKPYEPPKISAHDIVDQGIDAVLDEFGIKPPWLRDLLKRGAWAGLEKGSEAAMDDALDQTHLSPKAKEAFKKSMEAVFKLEF